MQLLASHGVKEDFALEVKRLHGKVKDLYRPKAWIYWADLSISGLIGWTALLLASSVELFSLPQALLVVLSGIALYRALAFTHELTHLRAGAVPGFRVGWSLIVGIPLLAPHFMYRGIHNLHHQHRSYGTGQDAEYLPLAEGPPIRILNLFVMVPIFPVFLVMRFGVLTPLAALSSTVRSWVLRRCSTMGLRVNYARVPHDGDAASVANAEEAGCCGFVWSTSVLLAFGALPWRLAGVWWAAWMVIGILNMLRCVGATHRYRSTGEQMTLPEQLDDSVNVESRSLLTAIICPVGLRWHALHHLFPSLPYHALGMAHRRIMADLPSSSFYRATLVPSVWAGVAGIWLEAKVSIPKIVPTTLVGQHAQDGRPRSTPNFEQHDG